MRLQVAQIWLKKNNAGPFIGHLLTSDGTWRSVLTGMQYGPDEIARIEPWIVIDPANAADRREVKDALVERSTLAGLLDRLTPKVKPKEPMSYGAVVKDGGERWSRVTESPDMHRPWFMERQNDEQSGWRAWSAFSDTVEIVFEGV